MKERPLYNIGDGFIRSLNEACDRFEQERGTAPKKYRFNARFRYGKNQ